MAFSDYNTDPAQNTVVGSTNIAEFCPPGNLNNGLRQIMADMRSAFSSALGSFFGAADLATARTALGAAASGSNADITALTGLTDPYARSSISIRSVQSGTLAGTSSVVTVLTTTFTVDAAAVIDIELSFNQSYAGTATNTQSQILLDGSPIGLSGTGTAYQAVVAYGDQAGLAAGSHTLAMTWLGDSTVTLNNAKLRGRIFYS